MVFVHESFVLAWFLKKSKHNVWVSQSIFASDEDPKIKLTVRIDFITAKSDTLCVLSTACTHFKLTKCSILNTIQV